MSTCKYPFHSEERTRTQFGSELAREFGHTAALSFEKGCSQRQPSHKHLKEIRPVGDFACLKSQNCFPPENDRRGRGSVSSQPPWAPIWSTGDFLLHMRTRPTTKLKGNAYACSQGLAAENPSLGPVGIPLGKPWLWMNCQLGPEPALKNDH